MIPFSPPRILPEMWEELKDTLESGWITTGPKTKQFEKELAAYCNAGPVLAVNSATAGMEMMLRWYGVGAGDEVIIPAYTYCATANVVMHVGATPVMVDTREDDFNIDVEKIKSAITPKTKVIVPVDIAGMACDYEAIMHLAKDYDGFTPSTPEQEQHGRILVLTDAAHSFGGLYKGKRIGSQTDAAVFSFHAVKNLTTAEGGAIVLNLPKGFDTEAIYKQLNTKSLHGQTKDALAKTKLGGWQYDVVEPGYKCNMTDLQACLGLVGLKHYQENLDRRRRIFELYDAGLADNQHINTPMWEDADRTTSFHLYMIRLPNASEEQRNKVIELIAADKVSVNVHFIPLPLLTAYKQFGYAMSDFPQAYSNYKGEITLPVFYDLSDEQVETVIRSVNRVVQTVMG